MSSRIRRPPLRPTTAPAIACSVPAHAGSTSAKKGARPKGPWQVVSAAMRNQHHGFRHDALTATGKTEAFAGLGL